MIVHVSKKSRSNFKGRFNLYFISIKKNKDLHLCEYKSLNIIARQRTSVVKSSNK